MAIKSLFAVLGMIGALVVSSEAHATTCTSSGCSGTIKKMIFNASDNVPSPAVLTHSLELDQDIAPTGCTLVGGKYWVLKADTRDQDLVKALLAAYLAGKPVTLRKDDTAGVTNCTIVYASIE